MDVLEQLFAFAAHDVLLELSGSLAVVFAGSWGLETSEDIPEEDGHEAGFTVIHEIERIGCSLLFY